MLRQAQGGTALATRRRPGCIAALPPELMVITVGRDSVEPTLISLHSKLARRSLAPPLPQVKTVNSGGSVKCSRRTGR
jgi:hypothetical protein